MLNVGLSSMSAYGKWKPFTLKDLQNAYRSCTT